MGKQEIKKLVLRVIAVSVIISEIIYSLLLINPETISKFDFNAFYKAADTITAGKGSELYNIAKFTPAGDNIPSLPFKSPPPVLLLFLPLSILPYLSAYYLYVIANAVLFLSIGFLLTEVYKKIDKSSVFFLLSLFVPSTMVLLTGQISFIILIIWIFIYKNFESGKNFKLGLTSGLLFMKPQYILLIPFLLIRIKDKLQFFKGLFIAFAMQLFISFCLVNFRGLTDYLPFLLKSESGVFGSDSLSQVSVVSFLQVLSLRLNLPLVFSYFAVYFIYLSLIIALIIFRKRFDADSYFQLSTLLTLIVVPHLWDYDLVILSLPLLFLWAKYVAGNKKINSGAMVAFILIYFSWLLRFLGYSYLISLPIITASIIFVCMENSGNSRPVQTRVDS